MTLPIITHFGGKGFPQQYLKDSAKGLKMPAQHGCLNYMDEKNKQKRVLTNCKVIKHGNVHQLLNPNHNSFPSCFCSHPTTSTLLSPKEDRWL